jgi:hypothetical protein
MPATSAEVAALVLRTRQPPEHHLHLEGTKENSHEQE